MSPNYSSRKASRKQHRCEAIIQRECGISSSEEPTRFVGILNAGLSTSLTDELVLGAASPHGTVTQLVMLPNSSYCFLECSTIADAESIFNAMHGVSQIGQGGAVVYLAYFKQLPRASENGWAKPLPPGLYILPDFVTSDEERDLLAAIRSAEEVEEDVSSDKQKLKHRGVLHFGYEFLYGINNVDPNRPLEQKIPQACDILWPRLQRIAEERDISLDWKVADQLTVNHYEPGHGIPAHVDTHSAFLDPILSLSLEGDVVMEFRKGSERIPVLLLRRSLLIMSGEARYDWTHGITPRVSDIVPSASGGALTTQLRSKRTSFTFRCLRRAPCNCSFPTLCDSHHQEKEKGASPKVPESVAVHLEEQNVHSVYENIANHFSETRHTPWPQVAEFLASFEPGSVLLDVGCGNGKYLHCNLKALTIGCDRSSGLLKVCTTKKENVFRCDCLQLPVRSETVDGCICIAVIHHLSTPERRLAAVREMARVLRPGGTALIYVWAKNQRGDERKSSYLLQNKAINKRKVTEEDQRHRTIQELKHLQVTDSPIDLPIHTNRTNFLQQDILVPWKLKGKEDEEQQSTFLRYYHVFEKDELEQLVEMLPEIEFVRSYYDQGNHCVIFRRK